MTTYSNRQTPLHIKVSPADTTRLGRMLQGGRLTATMRSKKTGEHITLTYHAMAKLDGKWQHVIFEKATHVFMKMGYGEYGSGKIGTFYPQKENLYWDSGDSAWRYAALHTLFASESGKLDTEHYEIFEESRCGVCGKMLTDPVSIERGIGPTCLGAMTNSVHYHQRLENLDVALQSFASAPKGREANPIISNEANPTVDKRGRELPRSFEALAAAVNR